MKKIILFLIFSAISAVFLFSTNYTEASYDCSLGGSYPDQASCNASCKQTANCAYYSGNGCGSCPFGSGDKVTILWVTNTFCKLNGNQGRYYSTYHNKWAPWSASNYWIYGSDPALQPDPAAPATTIRGALCSGYNSAAATTFKFSWEIKTNTCPLAGGSACSGAPPTCSAPGTCACTPASSIPQQANYCVGVPFYYNDGCGNNVIYFGTKNCSCTLPWGGTIANGASVTAHNSNSVPCGSTCASQTRTCSNGVLSGSYASQNCTVQACPANQIPTANITSPSTNLTVASGTNINFSGTGTDPDGTIAGYEWRESNCTTGTLLSSSSTFPKSNFSTGSHTVYFRVKDNSNAWSTNCPSRVITVNSCSPTYSNMLCAPTLNCSSNCGQTYNNICSGINSCTSGRDNIPNSFCANAGISCPFGVQICPACGSGNRTPLAMATISRNGTTYADSITVTRGVATPVYLSAAGSTDPDGWTNATMGVSSGGKCEWNADLNQGSPTFERAINNPASPANCNISLGSLTFNDSPGTYIYPILKITDKLGAQSAADTISVTVQAPAPTPPASPSNLSAAQSSCSQINLAWTDNSGNETGFRIERKTGATGTYSEIATVGANITAYQNTGITQSTSYYYRIRAYNATGNSGYSNESNAATPACAPVCTPSCGACSVSCGGGTQNCTLVDCSTSTVSCNTDPCPPSIPPYTEVNP